jgi:prepilin-type N-terminal cleavage/methylation domain-containing protein
VENKKEEMKMEKRRRNKKGFTMIELMIVITVIGILAIVLLPRLAGLRDEARAQGVEPNLRAAQGLIEIEITKEVTSAAAFADFLKTKLDGTQNPITGTRGARSIADGTAPDNYQDNAYAIRWLDSETISGSALKYATSESALAATMSAVGIDEKQFDAQLGTYPQRAGLVVIQVFRETGTQRLTTIIYGYDAKGKYIANSRRLIYR